MSEHCGCPKRLVKFPRAAEGLAVRRRWVWAGSWDARGTAARQKLRDQQQVCITWQHDDGTCSICAGLSGMLLLAAALLTSKVHGTESDSCVLFLLFLHYVVHAAEPAHALALEFFTPTCVRMLARLHDGMRQKGAPLSAGGSGLSLPSVEPAAIVCCLRWPPQRLVSNFTRPVIYPVHGHSR